MCQYASVRMADMEDRTRLPVLRCTSELLSTQRREERGRALGSCRVPKNVSRTKLSVSRKQIEKGVNVARSQLNGMIESFSATACKLSRRAAVKEMMQTKGLLDKWCINFLALIALTGGGKGPRLTRGCNARAILRSMNVSTKK
ncbi:hypothetical protein FGB62_405g013 [Gracilaria domingensis]|nr:hypothetical protein FGB62_405g013 [Gracilaria domingensis]